MKTPTKKQIDFLSKLSKKKYREEHRKFLVENSKVIWEEYQNKDLDSVYATDNFFDEHEDKMQLFKDVYRLSEKDFKKISAQVHPAGIMAVFNYPKQKNFRLGNERVLILDNISDPGNMGTIIRTADWFGFGDIFLSEDCVEVYNPKVVSASMGSIFRVNIYEGQDIVGVIKKLKKEDYSIVVSDLSGDEMDVKRTSRDALVIGSESKGVRKEILRQADYLVRIPQVGQAESLNASVAAGILMNQVNK